MNVKLMIYYLWYSSIYLLTLIVVANMLFYFADAPCRENIALGILFSLLVYMLATNFTRWMLFNRKVVEYVVSKISHLFRR